MSDRARRHLEFPETDLRIPVPDDPQAERAAVAADPEFQRLVADARQDFAEGRGIPAEDLYTELGYTPPHQRLRMSRRPKATYNGQLVVHVPQRMHRELAKRAAAQGVSIDQLVLSFVSRGLSEDASADNG